MTLTDETERDRGSHREGGWRGPVAIVSCGIAVSLLVAWLGGAPARDTTVLIATALGAAAVVVLLALGLRSRSSRSRVGTQAAAVALASVSATIVGILVGARAMFISAHDLTALGVIVATATGVGLAVAWRLGTSVDDDVAALADLSERLASGETASVPSMRTADLGRIGADMVDMAQRLAAAHERELALERSRRELVAWISHDLRSPLAAIRAMAEAIEDGIVDTPADIQRYSSSISDETQRLAALVEDLFELSRVTSGLLEIHPERVRLDALLAACVQGAAPLAESAGVQLRTPPPDAAAELGDLKVSQPETLRVLRNLLDNAIRHTPEGGCVTIGVESDRLELELTVLDQCGGIPTPDLERVFDVAFKGSSARDRGSGAGLGLTVARELAEVQEGSIVVANHDGGCCFSVRLPRWLDGEGFDQ